MSVSVTKAEGVTVLALTFDPQSNYPPLCQLLKSLCCTPLCCTASEHMRALQRMSQSVLAALHIVMGVLNIGLGVILMNSGGASGWQMDETAFPVWLGILFIVFGISCILSEKFPNPCLVSLNAILNLLGVAFAITGIVLYSINMAGVYLEWMCRFDRYSYYEDTPPPKVPADVMNTCLEGKHITQILVYGINGTLILLSVLELCVTISAAVVSIKALMSRDKNRIKDPEQLEPLLDAADANRC